MIIDAWGVFILDKIFCADNRRVPAACNGIQVNYCKNPLCPNFGIPVSNETQSRGRYANPLKQDGYVAKKNYIGGKKHGLPIIEYVCKYCKARFPAKSNLGIFEEASRYSSYLEPVPDPACPNKSCINHGKSILENKNLYRNKGFSTKSRSTKKYLCKSCGSHISVKVKSTKRQRIPHRNKYIFKALCNKVPLRCIADIFDFELQTIYDRIDFLYRQCKTFVAARERKLQNSLDFKRLYLSVDRQIYLVNWWHTETKKNVPIYATGCADNDSKYVFAMESNYDPEMKWNEIEEKANLLDDYSRTNVFRRFARLWLREDFQKESLINELSDKTVYDFISTGKHGDVDKDIRTRYRQASVRKDVELADNPNKYIQLPKNGMIVRLDYCLYAFFVHLKRMLPNVGKLRFFLDQESGIRAACLSAFRDEILNRTCDAFYVSINRMMTVHDRKKAAGNAKEYLINYMNNHPGLTLNKARLQVLLEQLHQMDEIGQYQDKWFDHPFPTIMEPEKKVCHLTDYGDYTNGHRAWLYNKASLMGINHFFVNVRRKQSLLERPIATPSSLNRKWYGYSPYNPAIINKILLIQRVWYNYLKKNRRTKVTPAMKLGLAKAPIDPEVIIYGRTISESPVKRRSLKTERIRTNRDFLKRPEPHSVKHIPISLQQSIDSNSEGQDSEKINQRLQTLYLDLETTGLDKKKDEIVEISIVDDAGKTILNSLVKSTVDIHPEATKTHGITKNMLAEAPTVKDLEEDIIELLTGKHVVTYPISFDMRFLTYQMRNVIAAESCCMLEFAEYYGRLHKEPWPYQWQSLKFAARFVKYEWFGPQHRALSDALACRAVWRYMMKNPIIY